MTAMRHVWSIIHYSVLVVAVAAISPLITNPFFTWKVLHVFVIRNQAKSGVLQEFMPGS